MILAQPQTLAFHRYTLKPRLRLNALTPAASESKCNDSFREGALLKIEFKSGEVGFADCFPWPELGDFKLDQQLQHLKNLTLTPLLKQSLKFAHQDAIARKQDRSLFEGLKIPASHALLTSIEELTEQTLQQKSLEGFSLIKLKCGAQLLEEAQQIKRLTPLLQSLKMKLRLDFNHSLKCSDTFKNFLDILGESTQQIDWIEDPFPFSLPHWTAIQNEYSIRLALDYFNSPHFLPPEASEGFSVLIIKPAVQNWEDLLELSSFLKVSVCITSYLDHPLGQLTAAWVAASARLHPGVQLEPCGLLSHTAYEPQTSPLLLKTNGPFLQSPPGTGFGLNDYLTSISWEPLSL